MWGQGETLQIAPCIPFCFSMSAFELLAVDDMHGKGLAGQCQADEVFEWLVASIKMDDDRVFQFFRNELEMGFAWS